LATSSTRSGTTRGRTSSSSRSEARPTPRWSTGTRNHSRRAEGVRPASDQTLAGLPTKRKRRPQAPPSFFPASLDLWRQVAVDVLIDPSGMGTRVGAPPGDRVEGPALHDVGIVRV